MILLLVALLGFSALCFADPVLMVRRHGQVHLRGQGSPDRTVIGVTASTLAPNAPAAFGKEDGPVLRDRSLFFQLDRCALDAMGDPADVSFWRTINGD